MKIMEKERLRKFLQMLVDSGGGTMVDVGTPAISQLELRKLREDKYVMTDGTIGKGNKLKVTILQKGRELLDKLTGKQNDR